MAKKKNIEEDKKEIQDSKDESIVDDFDFEEDFEENLEGVQDFEEDIDIEEELGLLDTEDTEAEIEEEEEEEKASILDKEEEKKQLFLSTGIHIGTKLLTNDFRRRDWHYRRSNYGLFVIDLTKTDERIKTAAKFLSRYVEEGSDRIIVSSVRRYGKQPVRKFCEVIGCRAITNRFIPGSLTNPIIDTYIRDAAVVVIVDPHADKVILREAKLARIPVVSLFDTDDHLQNIDLAIPANNRGKKALGLAFFLLAREIQLQLGKISSEQEFAYTLEEFTSNITPVYRQN
ncbi:MAG: 30S ribosomal protein S2 [Promethearchaeia archaeon]